MTYGTRSDDTPNLLPDLECWELLAAQHFGRLAYHLINEVHLVPINYLAQPETSRLLFRTAQGSKLLGVAMHHDVAFEIDHVGDNQAWSVVARGRAVELDGASARDALALPIRSWVANEKPAVVAIEVNQVTGRRYQLRPSRS